MFNKNVLREHEGIIEAACLTVGDDEDDIMMWIEHFGEAVNRRLPNGVYFDRQNCRLVDEYDHPMNKMDHKEFEKLLDEFEGILDEAERETDSWWEEDE